MGNMGEKAMEEKTLSCYGLLLILIKSGKNLVFSHLLYYYHEEDKIQFPIHYMVVAMTRFLQIVPRNIIIITIVCF